MDAIKRLGGVGYVTYHTGQTAQDAPLALDRGLLARPSDVGTPYQEVRADVYAKLMSAVDAKRAWGRPLFVNILVHEYNFYLARGENWARLAAVMQTDQERQKFRDGFFELVRQLTTNAELENVHTGDIVDMYLGKR